MAETTIESRAFDWMTSLDTGASSKAMAMFFMRGKIDSSLPWDAADFGRCYRLIKRIPEWKSRFPEMAAQNKAWSRLLSRWDELSAAYEKFCDEDGNYRYREADKRIYDAFQSILDQCTRVEKKSDGWVSLGGGMSFKVGER